MSVNIITKSHPRYTAYGETAVPQVTATVRADKHLQKIRPLLKAGVSHFRFNLSHYKPDEQSDWVKLVRKIWDSSRKLGIPAGMMLDTKGPEFRLVPRQDVTVKSKGEYIVTADERQDTPLVIEIAGSFRTFPESAKGKPVKIGDGSVEGEIIDIEGRTLKVRLVRCPPEGFPMSAGAKVKLNLPGIDLTPRLPSLGEDDRSALKFFLSIQTTEGHKIPIDYVAQSFVKGPRDVEKLRDALDEWGATDTLIIPKFETAESVQPGTLEAIVSSEHTDGVMVARGDLANETSRTQVPALQRKIITTAHQFWKPVLIATEVYSSMRTAGVWQSSRPEAEDLRSAMDWAVDGVVLTAETAERDDPEEVIRVLLEQAARDENDIQDKRVHDAKREERRREFGNKYDDLLRTPNRELKPQDPFPLKEQKDFSGSDMALAGVYRANTRRAGALMPVTVKGDTVGFMAHFLPYVPVFPLTNRTQAVAKALLYRGVFPILVEDFPQGFNLSDLKDLMRAAIDRFGIGEQATDEVIGTMAYPVGGEQGLDTLIWVTVGP